MNKQEAIRAMLDWKKVRMHKWASLIYLYWSKDFGDITQSLGSVWGSERMEEGFWELYEEPVKEEAPEYVDIEVERLDFGLVVSLNTYIGISSIIGYQLERHNTRYFALWYMIDGRQCTYPSGLIVDTYSFASHVRFVREDLLGGIPDGK